MSQTTKTALFLIGATVLLVLSLVSGPRLEEPEVFRDIGEKFFPEFTDPSQATILEVVEFDSSTAELRPFVVQLRNGRWTIPSHHDYPADAKDRMATAASLLVDLKKEDFRSDGIEDHAKFGVLDPSSESTVDGGSGKRVTFKDGAGNVLASLIIGKEVKSGSGLRYVRLPDKKRTYVATLAGEVSTNFSDWIDTDLLQLSSAALRKLVWDNYRIDEGSRSRVDGERFEAVKVSNQWTMLGLGADEEVDTTALNEVASTLDQLKIVGVRAKPAGLTEQLSRAEGITLSQSAVMALLNRGFYLGNDGNLYSNEGDLHAMTDKGLACTLRFGEILFGTGADVTAGVDKEGEQALQKPGDEGAASANRFLMITVAFDEGLLKRPSGEEVPAEELAKRGSARDEIQKLARAVESYRVANDSLPETLAALTTGEAPLLPELPKDPWGGEYGYTIELEGGYQISSLGADGFEGGTGANADVVSNNIAFEDQLKKSAEEWKTFRASVTEGEKLADDLRRRFAPWFYVIDDASFRKLRRDKHEVTKQKAPPAPKDGQQ
ncbi:MAG: DUF4340 domain-containing protein [Planctomycetota bacterium]